MKLQNIRGDRTATRYLPSPNKASNTRNEFHLIKFLDKAVLQKPQRIQAVAKTISCSPQTNRNAPLQNTTLIQFTEKEEEELVPIKRLHHSMLGTGRYSACYPWRNVNTNLVTNP